MLRTRPPDWNTKPLREAATWRSPSSGRSSPAARRSSRVLPQPGGPTSAAASPASRLKSNRSTRIAPRAAMRTPLSVSAAPAGPASDMSHQGHQRVERKDRDHGPHDRPRPRARNLVDVFREGEAVVERDGGDRQAKQQAFDGAAADVPWKHRRTQIA